MSLLCDDFKNLAVELQAEVGRARAKFPRNANLNLALQEEVGELARAQLQGEDRDRIRREALQVMGLCVRIMEEGDASLTMDEQSMQK